LDYICHAEIVEKARYSTHAFVSSIVDCNLYSAQRLVPLQSSLLHQCSAAGAHVLSAVTGVFIAWHFIPAK